MKKPTAILLLTFLSLALIAVWTSGQNPPGGYGAPSNAGGGSGGGGGGGVGIGFTGVNAQTANYTATSADNGKLITMTGTALTLTLPNPPPSATWNIQVENLSSLANNLAISRNGLTINGVAADLSIARLNTLAILTDGTNYFTTQNGGVLELGLASITTAVGNGSTSLTSQNVKLVLNNSANSDSQGTWRILNAAGNVSFLEMEAIGQVHPGNGAYRFKLSDQGQCTMAAGACSAQALGSTYTTAPLCGLTWTGTGTLTGIIKVASTTTTMTPTSSVGTDTEQVNWFCFGN